MDGSIAEPNGTIREEPIFLEDGGPNTCCDTATEPGQNNNQICKEGYACCPDGTWSCSIGDGKTFPCGGVLVENPVGTVCDTGDSNCCDPAQQRRLDRTTTKFAKKAMPAARMEHGPAVLVMARPFLVEEC
jgi:hypothetical protein